MTNAVLICLFSGSGFDRAAQGLVGAGQRLAADLGAPLAVLLMGSVNAELQEAVSTVVDKVFIANNPELTDYQPELYLKALTQIGKALGPRAILLSNDTYSQELAPRLAYRLNGSAAGDAVAITANDGLVYLKRAVYGGKAVATIALKKTPAIIWLRARAFEPPTSREADRAVTETLTLDLAGALPTKIIERHNESNGETRLEDATVIISGGRGLGGPAPFEELKQLAAVMGAQVAASRAACDSGWCPPTWQVGQTGKKVAPGLYLAVAISGASQHLAGISDAKNIAAINTDADAPIFKHCRFGIVEDYRKVLPLLREKLAAAKR